MTEAREFSVAGSRVTDQRGPVRWIVSHVLNYKGLLLLAAAGMITQVTLNSLIPFSIGRAFDAVLESPPDQDALTTIVLAMVVVVVMRGVSDLIGSFSAEIIAKRLERDARDELYLSLLGKSQTFHNRQRVGDLMARAANDVRQLNDMITPGLLLILESIAGLVVPIVMIGLLDYRLLPPPLLFVLVFAFALRRYVRELAPVSGEMRAKYGDLNARLAEAVTGIEVVKATSQERAELNRFETNARAYRNAAVAQGKVQARYLPTLILSATIAASLLLGLFMFSRGQLSVGQLITYLGLVQLLRFPTFISIFTFSLVQLGIASAHRILELLNEETTLDENSRGHSARIEGQITFDHVSLSLDGELILKDVSFVAEPGETVAIVGETGSGKTTLTKLVNRIYDVDEGRVLIDGVDVRDWNLDALRSQISIIEQDIVLFPRPVVENIAFSTGQQAAHADIERAAKDAQAHDFITKLPQGYQTVIGERGVTLSGGQRQRVAIARALLTDPRILVIDDATSAVDSATEDQIQRAITRVLEGRTTLLITHRLSQIRWADRILVIRKGRLIDQGTHGDLMERCETYRRIFAPYADLQPVAAA